MLLMQPFVPLNIKEQYFMRVKSHLYTMACDYICFTRFFLEFFILFLQIKYRRCSTKLTICDSKVAWCKTVDIPSNFYLINIPSFG